MRAPDIDVCVCTFRRSSLMNTLRSLAMQRLPSDMHVRVIVVDNDDTPSARELVQQAGAGFGLRCLYLHAPAHNISIARNACLNAATAAVTAFIDDDEIADPDWLMELVGKLQAGDCDVAFGPVVARYGPNAPRWVKAADLHSIRPVIRAGGRIETGYTCNVLFKRDVIGRQRFEVDLGRSGGEDSCFFSALYASGVRLGYCPTAIAYEDVPATRARMRWLLARAFRSGQVHGRLFRGRMGSIPLPLAVAASKALYCTVSAALWIASAAAWRRYLVRAALHAGVVARLLGKREIQLY